MRTRLPGGRLARGVIAIAAAAWIAASACADVCSRPVFRTGMTFPSNPAPAGMAVGDLDGDGWPDVVVSNEIDDAVTVLWGSGGGLLLARDQHLVGGRPAGVALIDVDADADLDVAVACRLSDAVWILRNDGGRTFVAMEPIPAGDDPVELTVADLDDDGDLDLAVGSVDGRSVSTLANAGSGAFSIVWTVTLSFPIESIAAGDLDADGLPDLAVASGSLKLLRNLGDGTFADWEQFGELAFAQSVIAADLDGDGDTDVVATNGWKVVVLLNQGKGDFEAAVPLEFPLNESSLSDVALPDLDRDGDPDLAILDLMNEQLVTLLNDGAGGFTDAASYASGDTFDIARILGVGDLDRDGVDDVVYAAHYDDAVIVHLGSVDDGLWAPDVVPLEHAPFAVCIDDLDGDGDLDLAVSTVGDDGISILLRADDGGYRFAARYDTPDTPRAVASGDIDGDGDADLAIATWGDPAITILENDGNAVFDPLASHTFTDGGGASVALRDLDGDGDLDLVATTLGFSRVWTLSNDGSGTFGDAMFHPVGTGPVSLVVVDLDGDGDLDVATANQGVDVDTVSILINDGSGAFATAVHRPVDPGPRSITAGDFDSNGTIDLAVACRLGSSVVVLANDGAAEFRSAISLPLSQSPLAIVSADFDGDRLDDLAVFTQGISDRPGRVDVFVNDAASGFGLVRSYLPEARWSGLPESPSSIPAADLDGDGCVDLVISGAASNTVSMMYNACRRCPAPGDINGDGQVNATDLSLLLGAWGTCAICTSPDCPADLDANCLVDESDLALLLSNWTPPP